MDKDEAIRARLDAGLGLGEKADVGLLVGDSAREADVLELADSAPCVVL